jgi:ComF family protein
MGTSWGKSDGADVTGRVGPESEVREPMGHRARRVATSIVRRLGDAIVPPVCLACHVPLADHDTVCANCWRQIDFVRAPLCDRLGIPLPFDTGGRMISGLAAADPPSYDRARAVAVFSGTTQQLIHGFKYSDRQDCRRLFGRWLAASGSELLAEADVLVPIPLNRWRLLSRRYNQAAILSCELARLTGIETAPTVLARVRSTASQVGMTREQRRLNVAGAFQVAPRLRHQIDRRRVLLIDDVITTGATVEAATRVLKAAGATRVDVLALAIVAHTTG